MDFSKFGIDEDMDMKEMFETLGRNPETMRMMKKLMENPETINKLMGKKMVPKISSRVKRNDKCPCGSEKKYKICCIDKHEDSNPIDTLIRK